MPLDSVFLRRAALMLACALTVADIVSIAAGQILLGAAIVTLLVARERWRVPPVWMPLAFLIGWTFVALAFSPDPAAGMPQVKKFFVFAVLPVLYTVLRRVGDVIQLVLAWGVVECGQALYSIGQFGWKWEKARQAGEDFYRAYIGQRITGTMSHWLTLGGVEMIVLLMLGAVLLFAARRRFYWWLWACAATITLSLTLGGNRGIWVGTAAGAIYLVARWKAWLLLSIPVLLAALYFAGPSFIRDRAESLIRPHGTVDSNQHRSITWRTGVEMVKASPVVGLGPEMPGRQFDRYLPKDVRKPLPEGFYGHLHNIYLQYAAERGIPALLALLWLFGMVLWHSLRAAAASRGPDSDRRALLHGTVAAVIGVMVAGLAEVNLGDSEVLTMFLAVVAAGYVARQAESTEARAA